MRPIILVDNQLKYINNPFIVNVVKEVEKFDENKIYIIRRIENYDFDYDYLKKRITENIYWSETEDDIDKVVLSILEEELGEKKINVIIDSVVFDKAYVFPINNMVYFLSNNEVYYYNTEIINKFNYSVVIHQEVAYEDLIPKMLEIGMVGDKASINNLNKYKEYYPIYYFLYLMEYIDELKVDGDLEAYKNIILVEKYLNSLVYDNTIIDFKKLNEYNLDYVDDELTFHNYGLFNKTGRIFQTSQNGFNLQTLPNKFKDVVRVKSSEEILFEIDFSAFEYNLLCQILNIPIRKDPHIEIFEQVIGEYDLEFEEKRALGKQINYGIIFGSSMDSIVNLIISHLGDLEREKLNERVQAIQILSEREELKNELKNELKQYGYIINYFGRKLLVEKDNAELNYFVQSSASDFFYIKFLKIVELFKKNHLNDKNRILVQRFDSILMQLNIKDCIENNLIYKIAQILNEEEYGLKSSFKMVKGKNWKEMS